MSKGTWWTNPNDDIQILERTTEALKKYGRFSGANMVNLTKEHIDALLNGKVIAFNDSEYVTFLKLVKEGDDDG